MKSLNKYVNKQLNISSYINEYLVGKITHYNKNDYYKRFKPKDKDELRENIIQLFKKENTYDFNCIDTSNIEDMSFLFDDLDYDNTLFEHNFIVSDWDVSNVKNMNGTFAGCENFNDDLSKWDVSNVKDMRCMFVECKKFKGKGLENWDVSNVEDFTSTFSSCKFFNADLSKWDVHSAKTMSFMFSDCLLFDCDLSSWDVSNVIYMNTMFNNCYNFEGKGLENWDVSNVKMMNQMFAQCKNFECDLSNWNPKSLINMNEMFKYCEKFNAMTIRSWEDKIKNKKVLNFNIHRNPFHGTRFAHTLPIGKLVHN